MVVKLNNFEENCYSNKFRFRGRPHAKYKLNISKFMKKKIVNNVSLELKREAVRSKTELVKQLLLHDSG